MKGFFNLEVDTDRITDAGANHPAKRQKSKLHVGDLRAPRSEVTGVKTNNGFLRDVIDPLTGKAHTKEEKSRSEYKGARSQNKCGFHR